jgi:hypothetical protein
MQHFVDSDNAGRWLSMDRSYPGAEAQKQNIMTHLARMATKHAGEAGAVAGHIPGAIAGVAAGKLGDVMVNKLAARGAENLVQDLNAWKPPKGPVKPGSSQRGSFSLQNDNPINRFGTKNSQRSGGAPKVERNPRSEYNANKQIAGVPVRSQEQEDMLERMSK